VTASSAIEAVCRWNRETIAVVPEDDQITAYVPKPVGPSPEDVVALQAVKAERRLHKDKIRPAQDKARSIVQHLLAHHRLPDRSAATILVLYRENAVVYLVTTSVRNGDSRDFYVGEWRGAKRDCGVFDRYTDPAALAQWADQLAATLQGHQAVLYYHLDAVKKNQGWYGTEAVRCDAGWFGPMDLTTVIAQGAIPQEPKFNFLLPRDHPGHPDFVQTAPSVDHEDTDAPSL
jgi:hypothetical protein